MENLQRQVLLMLQGTRYSDTVQPDDKNSYLPVCLKALVNDVAHRTYVSACMAETKKSPAHTNDGDSFKPEHKMLDKLKFEFRIMYFKRQRAQAEVDMFAEAIACIAVSEHDPPKIFQFLELI
jgi:hypothetical protein